MKDNYTYLYLYIFITIQNIICVKYKYRFLNILNIINAKLPTYIRDSIEYKDRTNTKSSNNIIL